MGPINQQPTEQQDQDPFIKKLRREVREPYPAQIQGCILSFFLNFWDWRGGGYYVQWFKKTKKKKPLKLSCKVAFLPQMVKNARGLVKIDKEWSKLAARGSKLSAR